MKDFNGRFKNMQNEQGLTLVEVLASVVLLTLLLTTFITVFIQSAKMNQTSEMIIDATYIAQTEMEKVYSQSKKEEYDLTTVGYAMEDLGYHQNNSFFENNNVNDTGYDVTVSFKGVEESEYMNQVIIKVFKNN